MVSLIMYDDIGDFSLQRTKIENFFGTTKYFQKEHKISSKELPFEEILWADVGVNYRFIS